MAKFKVIVTGCEGLLGRHAQAALQAENGAAGFRGEDLVWDIVAINKATFENKKTLTELVKDADLVLHFAGINRASDDEVEFGNIRIARILASALLETATSAHLIYANSTHAENDSPYGRGKATAALELEKWAKDTNSKFTNTVLPHVFGEGAKPFYNNVTATLCQQLIEGQQPTINEGAAVELIHAGEIIDWMIGSFASKLTGAHRLPGKAISVSNLYSKLYEFNESRGADLFPALSSKFDVALFQTLQAHGFPSAFIRPLKLNSDQRGTLFEASKGGSSGQTFLSWTHPGVERGNHFHRYKVERFVVVHGQATIKMRHVLDDTVHVFEVSGDEPTAIDMPSLYSHNIVNTGKEPLLTMFWAHEIFNPTAPDTWACPVNIDSSSEVIQLSKNISLKANS